jgi:A1 cistron-splicing factor AAR2
MELDQELAKRMLIEGGTFIFLDVPEGTEFGIDMKSWNTDHNFKGMKMIPPGVHFLFYRYVVAHATKTTYKNK